MPEAHEEGPNRPPGLYVDIRVDGQLWSGLKSPKLCDACDASDARSAVIHLPLRRTRRARLTEIGESPTLAITILWGLADSDSGLRRFQDKRPLRNKTFLFGPS